MFIVKTMANKNLLWCLLFLLNVINFCYGAPVHIGYPSTEIPAMPYYYVPAVISIAILFVVGLVFGCTCCPNKSVQAANQQYGLHVPRQLNEVSVLENVSEFAIFPPYAVVTDQSSLRSPDDKVTFEPLPDILPRKYTNKRSSISLRPAHFGGFIDKRNFLQDWLDDSNKNFPREQLQYLKEVGCGWFGRVVEGEACNIAAGEEKSPVIVKILREEASPSEHLYFLHEACPYRDLLHPNIVHLLGRCLESNPFLLIMEHTKTNLKSYLLEHRNDLVLLQDGVLLRMACNIAAGLQYMHEHNFAQMDLAAHNCFVGEDLIVKIGDYGVSFETFKEDYYYFGDVALPVRWYCPEVLQCTETTIETKVITPEANVWAFGIVLWEIFQFGDLPYEDLTNEEVLQKVIIERCRVLEEPHFQFPQKEKLYQIMKFCWRLEDERLKIQDIASLLNHLYNNRNNSCESPSFEERWNALKPAQEQSYVTTCANPLKFETDFVSSAHLISKPTLFSSSDYDVSNVSEISSFEYSGYSSHRASFDSYLSPSLRVLSGSIDELNETSAVSNGLENVFICSAQNNDCHPPLHVSRFQNCDGRLELATKGLRHVVVPADNGCSISLAKYSDVCLEQHAIQAMASDGDCLQSFTNDRKHHSVVNDIKSYEGAEKDDMFPNSCNQTSVSLMAEVHDFHSDVARSGMTNSSFTIPTDHSFSQRSSKKYCCKENKASETVGYVNVISDVVKDSNMNSEGVESPFTKNISHNSSSSDNIVPDIVISRSSFDERSAILDNKCIPHSTNESNENYMPRKKNFYFILNETSDSKNVGDSETSHGIDLSISDSRNFGSVGENGEIPMTSTPEKVTDSVPSSKNCHSYVPPYLIQSEMTVSSVTDSTFTLYETADEQDLGGSSPKCLAVQENEIFVKETEVPTEKWEDSEKDIMDVDVLASNLQDHSTSLYSIASENTASKSDITKFPSLNSTTKEIPDMCDSLCEDIPPKKEEFVSFQEMDPEGTPEINKKYHHLQSSNSLSSEKISSPVNSSSDNSMALLAKQTRDKNVDSFNAGGKVNGAVVEPDVFNVELVKDLKFSLDVQASSNHNVSNISDINLCNALSEFKNDQKNKIQEKICDEASMHSFLGSTFDGEQSKNTSNDICHLNYKKIYGDVSCGDDLNELNFSPYSDVDVPEHEKFRGVDLKNDVQLSEKKSKIFKSNVKCDNIYQHNVQMDSANYNIRKSGPDINCEYREERPKEFLANNLSDPLTIEDLETGEQQLVPQTVICNFDDDDDDDDDDDVLQIDTETNEAIIVDSSESLIGFVPSRSIEQLQECSSMLVEEGISPDQSAYQSVQEGISPDQSAYQSVQEENNSCTNSPTAPAVYSGNDDIFVTDDELSERTADILGDGAESSSVHNSENISESVSDGHHCETSVLPDICMHLPEMNDVETSDLDMFTKQHSSLNDERFFSSHPADGVLNSITLESEEILAGAPTEVDLSTYHKGKEADRSPVGELTLNCLDIVVSPVCSVASTPCREVYSPDFESDSDESSSGTSCTSTSGSFECIHNKFKHVIDVSVCDDVGEGNLTNESSLESSPVKVFSKCWDSTATPTRGLLKTPENKATMQMKKSVSFHEEGPHEIFQYPPPSDSSEDDFVDDDDFSWHVDYTSYADWDLQAGDDDDIPEEIIEIEELPCDKLLTPSYSRGISLRPIPGPMLYTLTGFTEDDLELPEMMGSSQFCAVPLEIEDDISPSDNRWAQDLTSVTKSDSAVSKSETVMKPFDSLELIIEEVQSDVETSSSSGRESAFSQSNGFADFSSDLSLKRDLSLDDDSSLKEQYEINSAKYAYDTVSPDGLEVEILSPEQSSFAAGSEFSDSGHKASTSDFSGDDKLPDFSMSASDSTSAVCSEAHDLNEVATKGELTRFDGIMCDSLESQLDPVSHINGSIKEATSENFPECDTERVDLVQDSSSDKIVAIEDEGKTSVIELNVSRSPCHSADVLCSDPHEQGAALGSCDELDGVKSECVAYSSFDKSSAKSETMESCTACECSSVSQSECDHVLSYTDSCKMNSGLKMKTPDIKLMSDEYSAVNSSVNHKLESDDVCDEINVRSNDSHFTLVFSNDSLLTNHSVAEENVNDATIVSKEDLQFDVLPFSSEGSVLNEENAASCHDSLISVDSVTKEVVSNTAVVPSETIGVSVQLSSEDCFFTKENCNADLTVHCSTTDSCCNSLMSYEHHKNNSSDSVPARAANSVRNDTDVSLPKNGSNALQDENKSIVKSEKSCEKFNEVSAEHEQDDDTVGTKSACEDELHENLCDTKDVLDGNCIACESMEDVALLAADCHCDETTVSENHSSSTDVQKCFAGYNNANESTGITDVLESSAGLESVSMTGECDSSKGIESSLFEGISMSCNQQRLEHCAEDCSIPSCDDDMAIGSTLETKCDLAKSFVSAEKEDGEPKAQKGTDAILAQQKDVELVIPSIIVTDADEFLLDDETENFIKQFGIFSATKQITDDDEDSQFAIMSEFSSEPFEDNFEFMCGTKIEEKDRIF